jgi:hypothetical protein
MLVDFEFSNFLSFRDTARLTLEAVTPFKELEGQNVITASGQRLLKSAAVYGANASGKSNLVKAVQFMVGFARTSAGDSQAGEPIAVTPYLLDVATESAPSRFQMTLLDGSERFRYGFEVDSRAVRAEWLLVTDLAKKRAMERPVFLRDEGGIDVKRNRITDAEALKQRTRDNALFLSVAAQWNEPTARRVMTLVDSVRALFGVSDARYQFFSATQARDGATGAALLEACRTADLGVRNIRVEEHELEFPPIEEIIKRVAGKRPASGDSKYVDQRIFFEHAKYDGDEVVGTASFDLERDESEGTRKYFRLMGPILDSLAHGYTVFVDELEAKLHPLLTRSIVRLFHNPEINRKSAQLVFCTHDTGLLSHGGLRRDQIWFVEKSDRGTSTLYPLSDFKKKVRKDTRIEAGYIEGRYGAIPFLGGSDALARLMEG